MLTRRTFLKGMMGWIAVGSSAALAPRWSWAAELPAGTIAASVMETLPGKRPLIKRTYRPINYETPLEVFNNVITPNDAFFVRWHLTQVPEIQPEAWRLAIGGDAVSHPYELTLEQLKHEFESVELTAVCQCGGNRRGFSEPHVPGIQWGHGAMGNARWKGVRLKEVLARAGLTDAAVEISFDGADTPVYDKTPDFIKSLPLAKALHEDTLIAYEMNGETLPHLNGGPVRIVVPGWIATYWIKKVVRIQATSTPLNNFWMGTAYRTPKNLFPTDTLFPTQNQSTTAPVTEILINTLITRPEQTATFAMGATVAMQGLAWDGGHGIEQVEVSTDAGQNWQPATLGQDHGRYSFRQWEFTFPAATKGRHRILVRATNTVGATQPPSPVFNPSGYHHNPIQQIDIEVI
jgi:DMSO/TMAO reductase YedYZ molybdopterin-dependent catalytic subunit